jgi:prepilin-type N-terminal cleavage/methylation domain-containing protein
MRSYQTGFTLIEVSIVLVIIGLIVGGVLSGRELIEAARGRQQVSQIQEYTVGMTMFQSKYKNLPGDISIADAVRFNLYCDSCGDYDGIDGLFNGDGILKGYHAAAVRNAFLFPEPALFFAQLSSAGLIPGTYTFTGGGVAYPGVDFPAAKIDNSIGIIPITPYSWGGIWLAFCPTAGGYYFGWLSHACPTAPVKPAHGSYIDSKMDDGVPASGIVRAGKLVSVPDDQGVDPDDDPTNLCVTDVSGSAYNMSDNQGRCRIFVRIQ